MGDLLSWIESTNLARTVGSSVAITASLSAIHVLGFTLVTSGALLANLRALGALFRARVGQYVDTLLHNINWEQVLARTEALRLSAA